MKKLGKFYNMFVIFVIILKIIFIFLVVLTKYYKHKLKISNKTELSYYTNKYNLINFWKEKIENIFMICMGFICVIIFNPFNDYQFFIDKETRLLLFLFGIVILFTTNWQLLY